jgi:hypothetical protein
MPNVSRSVVPDYMIQFGISGDPEAQHASWDTYDAIADDVNVGVPFKVGSVSFSGDEKDSRRTDLWVGYTADPSQLEWWGKDPWERPIGMVVLAPFAGDDVDDDDEDDDEDNAEDRESFLYGAADAKGRTKKKSEPKNALQRLYSGYGEKHFGPGVIGETEAAQSVPTMLPGQDVQADVKTPKGVSVPRLVNEGASYIRKHYPLTDFIKKCERLSGDAEGAVPAEYLAAVSFYTPPGADPSAGDGGASGTSAAEDAFPGLSNDEDGEVNVAFTLPAAYDLRQRLRAKLEKRLANFDEQVKERGGSDLLTKYQTQATTLLGLLTAGEAEVYSSGAASGASGAASGAAGKKKGASGYVWEVVLCWDANADPERVSSFHVEKPDELEIQGT